MGRKSKILNAIESVAQTEETQQQNQEEECTAVTPVHEMHPKDIDAQHTGELEKKKQRLNVIYNKGIKYDKKTAIREARHYLNEATHNLVEVGCRLVLIKENEPRGTLTRILEEWQIPTSTAALWMQMARIYKEKPELAQKYGYLGQGKLLLLNSAAESEHLPEFASEYSDEDFERMSVAEMKDKIKNFEKELEEKDAKLKEVNAKNHQLMVHQGMKPAKVDRSYREKTAGFRAAMFNAAESIQIDPLDARKVSIRTKIEMISDLDAVERLASALKLGLFEDLSQADVDEIFKDRPELKDTYDKALNPPAALPEAQEDNFIDVEPEEE